MDWREQRRFMELREALARLRDVIGRGVQLARCTASEKVVDDAEDLADEIEQMIDEMERERTFEYA